MKESATKTVKPQNNLRHQVRTAPSLLGSRPDQEDLHREAMKRQLDFAEMVSEGRLALSMPFIKQV